MRGSERQTSLSVKALARAGAVMIQAATATGEPELLITLQAWQLRPEQFLYPWQTDDPR